MWHNDLAARIEGDSECLEWVLPAGLQNVARIHAVTLHDGRGADKWESGGWESGGSMCLELPFCVFASLR